MRRITGYNFKYIYDSLRDTSDSHYQKYQYVSNSGDHYENWTDEIDRK